MGEVIEITITVFTYSKDKLKFITTAFYAVVDQLQSRWQELLPSIVDIVFYI
jgi:hypothetical protein